MPLFTLLITSPLIPTQAVAKSDHVKRKLAKRQADRVLDPLLDEQVASGRFIACISSRPGQVNVFQQFMSTTVPYRVCGGRVKYERKQEGDEADPPRLSPCPFVKEIPYVVGMELDTRIAIQPFFRWKLGHTVFLD